MSTIAERLDALWEDHDEAHWDWLRCHEKVMVHIRRAYHHHHVQLRSLATIDALTPPQTESRTIRIGEDWT